MQELTREDLQKLYKKVKSKLPYIEWLEERVISLHSLDQMNRVIMKKDSGCKKEGGCGCGC